jgi:WD40 repeat protein
MLMVEFGAWEKNGVSLCSKRPSESDLLCCFDGMRIMTGSLDRTARVWDPKSGYSFIPTKLGGELMV